MLNSSSRAAGAGIDVKPPCLLSLVRPRRPLFAAIRMTKKQRAYLIKVRM